MEGRSFAEVHGEEGQEKLEGPRKPKQGLRKVPKEGEALPRRKWRNHRVMLPRTLNQHLRTRLYDQDRTRLEFVRNSHSAGDIFNKAWTFGLMHVGI